MDLNGNQLDFYCFTTSFMPVILIIDKHLDVTTHKNSINVQKNLYNNNNEW